MKNTIKFLGLIALAAVIGFSMAACGDGGDDDGGDKDPPIVGSWGNNSGVWTFNNNGTATFVSADNVTFNFTYSISGDQITTINIANQITDTRSFNVSGNTLTYYSATWTKQ